MSDLNKYKELFVSEAEDHLQRLNQSFLLLEKKPQDKEVLDELMRSAHTLKSSSATMGYKKMAHLTHVMEDIFDYARNDMLEITPKVIDQVFQSIDTLEKSLKSIDKTGKELDVSTITSKIKKLTGVKTQGVGKSRRKADGTPLVSAEKKVKKPRTQNASGGEPEAQEVSNALGSESKEDRSEHPSRVEKISHIKVPVERLDNLMNLMEEVLIEELNLEHFKQKDDEMEEVISRLSGLVSQIKRQVMEARLVPVEQIFARFPRLVRDLAHEQKKDIEFIVNGGDVELDRTIVDSLGEPLVHLLKNAVDHGVEKKGSIMLEAQRERDFVLIEVESDGKGIDFDRVKRTAIAKDIVTEAQIHAYNKEQMTDLLFHPRMSTRQNVTETSGRGVGLSVVKHFVDKLNGRIEIESLTEKEGTRFTLELPLTVAIIDALLIRIHGRRFAVPFTSVDRSVRVSPENIKSIADQDIAVVDGEQVPLIYMEDVLHFTEALDSDKSVRAQDNASTDTDVSREKEKSTVQPNDQTSSHTLRMKKNDVRVIVLVRHGGSMAGIVVDELIKKYEIIVKPLPSVLRNAKLFSGSTTLGDGKTVLILDVMNLLEKMMSSTTSESISSD